MRLFGSSGTRGVVGEGLTPEFVLRVAKAAGTVWDADSVAVGRDTRTTGELFVNAAASGLASVGVDVDLLGVASTPAVVRYADVNGVPALQITASHNPPEYNGVKLVGADGIELPVTRLERIEDVVLSDDFETADWSDVGYTRRVTSANDEYVEELLTAVDRRAIADADLKVALDPGHGAGCLTSPEFFRRLGCEVVTVNAQPDGHFPGRPPEPVEKHLGDLRDLVRAADADLGIAHDGDADRAMFVDERGRHVPGNSAFAALAREALGAGDTVVTAVNVSQRLVDVADEAGATVELTPIGATNIITRIQDLWTEGATIPISGEGNGGIFFPNYRLVRDGAFIAARFLELVAERPPSDVVAPFASYHQERVDIEYGNESELNAMLTAAEEFASTADAELDTIDGYRMDYGDAWVLVRPSGTEPKIRIYAEAQDVDRARRLASEVESRLLDALER